MKTVMVSAFAVALAGGTWTWVSPERAAAPKNLNVRSEAGERVGPVPLEAALHAGVLENSTLDLIRHELEHLRPLPAVFDRNYVIILRATDLLRRAPENRCRLQKHIPHCCNVRSPIP